ncbi:SUMF1/EgtB/PvdO family nonheme iron enzyme [Myxococcota bacterium]
MRIGLVAVLLMACQAVLGMENEAPNELPATEEGQRTPDGDSADARDHASCQAAPEGMVCIPGGPAVIGADDQDSSEKPRHVVEIPTFYVDKHEVTNGAYQKCEKAGVCRRRRKLPASYKGFLKPDQPAIPIKWRMAHTYCVWAGKRLPSEAEWEKVARGGMEERLYPWGEQSPTCERAAYKGCSPAKTRAVGSFAPGPFGVYDMAGNGYEWVRDWASDCYGNCRKPCGDACLGLDPLGPCDGTPHCRGHTHRVLKGGSWYWPPEQMRGSHRRGENPASGMHRLSFRCASTTPLLTTWPPLAITDPPQPLSDPGPPSEQELAKFRGVVDDGNVLKIEPCERDGVANLDCRDPKSYIKSNESAQRIWRPYVQNLGGGFVGLGADQSYSFIALARSRWAWIFDYDPTVVRIHTLIRIIVLNSESPADFIDAFKSKGIEQTRMWITEALADDFQEREAVDEIYRTLRRRLHSHYYNDMQPKKTARGFGWLRYAESYAYVRKMFQQGRILAVKGNMLTDKTLPSIAASARALNVPVRIYYPSNAEEQWKLIPQYRQNVAGLPFDEHSVVLRTLIKESYRKDDESPSYWHYVVHSGWDAQRKIQLEGYTNVDHFMEDRTETNLELLSLIRMPARTATEETTTLGARVHR